jgi:hypothetical protein
VIASAAAVVGTVQARWTDPVPGTAVVRTGAPGEADVWFAGGTVGTVRVKCWVAAGTTPFVAVKLSA